MRLKMPMLLRARKSRPSSAPENGEEEWSTGAEKPDRPKRNSNAARTYVDSEQSDSSSETQGEMESQHGDLLQEDKEQEVKACTVVLNRVSLSEKISKGELEQKEYSALKVGKSVSRIPTIMKRTPVLTQVAESPVSEKGFITNSAEPLEVTSQASEETVYVEEKMVSASACVPEPSLYPTLYTGSLDKCAEDLAAFDEIKQPLITITPRPPIRTDTGQEDLSEEKNKCEDTQIKDQSRCDPPSTSKSTWINDADSKIWATEALPSEAEETPDLAKNSSVDDILQEEPPWYAGLTKSPELEKDPSSSDVDCDDDLGDVGTEDSDKEKLSSDQCEDHVDSLELKERDEEQQSPNQFSTSEKPIKAEAKVSTRSSTCSSFFLSVLLPMALLLVGGFGQHVWHYGLPMSVVQLSSQLQLHWLEGFGLVQEPCSDDCRVHLVESIPQGLYPSNPSPWRSTADIWLQLLGKANTSVEIAASDLTLQDLHLSDPTDAEGRKVLDQLRTLNSKGVKLQIAITSPQTYSEDSKELSGADIRKINLGALTGGHFNTKLWVVDQKHLYIGSANMDWRSLSQMKELGLSFENCSCLAQDASRIFALHYSLGVANASLPPYWPARFSALSSSRNSLLLKLNGVPAQVYLSSATTQISARGRSDDLNTILNVISDAQQFVYISLMDYLPLDDFKKPLRFWPAIDSALRATACTSHVKVKLMVSCWEHSQASTFTFLQSLLVLRRPPLSCDIEVKVFTVPSTEAQKKIPFARVNHAKFMVTDRVLYVGTSNWSGNSFTESAGVGVVVNQTGSVVTNVQQTLPHQAAELFLRDWTSEYAKTLTVEDMHVCPLV